MKSLLLLFLLLFSAICKPQTGSGIQFQKETWDAIKLKAKKEHKNIFIDAYTTWCGPCKYMAATIFPDKEVGDFFNKNFINVSVQIDSSENDDAYIKSWYKDAKFIADSFKLTAYPTFLFLDSNAHLVHVMVGATNTPREFIDNAQNALNTQTQYVYLKSLYDNGKRDSVFLLELMKTAKSADDDSLFRASASSYLSGKNNLLTADCIELIAQTTTYSHDPGFTILTDFPKEVDAVLGKSQRVFLLNKIAFDEDIFPVIMINGKITRYSHGLTVYGDGEMNPNVSWSTIKEKIDAKYKDKSLTAYFILSGKLKYFLWLKEWKKFNDLLSDYLQQNTKPDTAFVNSMAQKLMVECDNQKAFEDALQWASILAHPPKKTLYYLETYSRILYNADKKSLAISNMKKYLSLSQSNDTSTLNKMEKGEALD